MILSDSKYEQNIQIYSNSLKNSLDYINYY